MRLGSRTTTLFPLPDGRASLAQDMCVFAAGFCPPKLTRVRFPGTAGCRRYLSGIATATR
jgi:hypothetical protein